MSYTVLIVDDSKLARMSVARALSTLQPDWTRLEAANADDALLVVKQSKVDLTLLDFNMPGRDGLELAVELKELHPSMPVAVISANSQVEIVARAEAAGATFLVKPLTEQALDVFLQDAVRRLKPQVL
jgi:CheY-like chemotaxis protein